MPQPGRLPGKEHEVITSAEPWLPCWCGALPPDCVHSIVGEEAWEGLLRRSERLREARLRRLGAELREKAA